MCVWGGGGVGGASPKRFSGKRELWAVFTGRNDKVTFGEPSTGGTPPERAQANVGEAGNGRSNRDPE